MALNVEHRLFTAAEFEQMGRAGILTEDDRVELIDGEIIAMTPIGTRHAACVDRLNDMFSARGRGRVQVRVQNPMLLDDHSEPQPDIMLLRPRKDYYSDRHPSPQDVLLLIEVAQSSLEYDRGFKLPRYARKGIPEVWIVDLDSDTVMQHRQPGTNGYERFDCLSTGSSIRAEALPDMVLDVSAILGLD